MNRDNYVAYLRWAGDTQHRHLVPCDSDAEGAFKVYRQSNQESDMQPHQERVIQEKKELDAKIDKLIPFIAGSIFMTLPPAEQLRLSSQLEYMQAYSNILGERIGAFQ